MDRGLICSVREVVPAVVAITSTALPVIEPEPPTSFLDVLREWGSTWMWDSLRLIGDDDWLIQSIQAGSCIAVTDGSYIKELHPNLSSAAFVLECTEGRGRIVGSFPEQSVDACAYRAELLGLLAIHLILAAINKIDTRMQGRVSIISDCLGALMKAADLPPNRIPSKCRHSDILKNIMLHCTNLSFDCNYAHVKAHQDDSVQYHKLSRAAQLNCWADITAKNVIWGLAGEQLPIQRVFPLEPVAVYIGKEKMTSDTGPRLRFWAHKHLARAFYEEARVLNNDQFDEVDWESVHSALYSVPRLFQVWACKQVNNIAGTNHNQAKYKPAHNPICPSCDEEVETCGHVLLCQEAGRVDVFYGSIKLLDDWLRTSHTDNGLRQCIVDYAKGRGSTSMFDIARHRGARFQNMAASQDAISWRRFMEGMISKEIIAVQKRYTAISGSKLSIENWAQGLVIKLLECAHGQWLYRNVQVHNAVSRLKAVERKEELQREIEHQVMLRGTGLDEQDRYLLEINVGDLDTSSGEDQYYWLLAIRAARVDRRLKEMQVADNASEHTRRRRA